MIEEWRKIPSFPNYEASSFGRIRRVDGQKWTKGEALKGHPLRGYLRVSLYKDAKAFSRFISCLVCEAFHGPRPTPKHHAAHGDGVKANNFSSNLRWATPSENEQDKFLHGTDMSGERSHRAILKGSEVEEMRTLRALNMVSKRRVRNGFYDEMAARFGVQASSIKKAALCLNWKRL